MRIGLLAMFLLCACSTARLNSGGQTIRHNDYLPPAVESGLRQAVTVYVEATCSHLDKATAHFSGFWATSKIVATAGQAMFARRHMFPDFALVGPDGSCVAGGYLEWHDSVDLLFILSRGSHAGALELAQRLPVEGESGYQFTDRVTIEKIEGSREFFGSKPMPRSSASGSPLLDANGKVLGMVISVGSGYDSPDKQGAGLFLSSMTISSFLVACRQCEK
jgi:hypothetical protein